MNVTAEKAAPEAVALLTKAAAQIKTEDAAATVKGGPGAATQLFANTHGAELESQLLALVQKAAVQTRLRDAYNDVMFKGAACLAPFSARDRRSTSNPTWQRDCGARSPTTWPSRSA